MPSDRQQILKDYLLQHGLKASRQREAIAEVFFNSPKHLRMDDLLQKVRLIDAKISQATVYRTMKLLTDCGLAEIRNFLDGHTMYEISDESGEHHDHLICTTCGSIVEFFDEQIESLQDKVAAQHGFTVKHHKMELYGTCANCQ